MTCRKSAKRDRGQNERQLATTGYREFVQEISWFWINFTSVFLI